MDKQLQLTGRIHGLLEWFFGFFHARRFLFGISVWFRAVSK